MITLSGYQAAIFIEREKFTEQYPDIRKKQSWRLDDVEKSMIVTKEGNRIYYTPNPDYIPLTKEERIQKDKEKTEADRFENEWIYQKLKEDYPDKDYAGKFFENYLREYET